MGHSETDRHMWPVGYVTVPQTTTLPCTEFWYLYASYDRNEKILQETKLEVTQFDTIITFIYKHTFPESEGAFSNVNY